MPTFLHAADLHLDSPLRGLEAYEGAPVETIRLAARDALRNLVQLALERQVDLVVIAGDLYDGDWADHRTGLFFVSQVQLLVNNGIPVVAIRGNHDAESQMTRSLPLPANPDGSDIMLRSDVAETRAFPDLNVVVHGRSFANTAEKTSMVPDYPAAVPGAFNIGLLHTSLTGAEGHDPYAPCTPADLIAKQYHYWALGHIHTRASHHDPDDALAAPIVFPGNLQGRHIRETGPKGCVLVEVDAKQRCKLTFHPLDVMRWEICALAADQADSTDDVLAAYEDWLRGKRIEVGDRLLAHRVVLEGRTALHRDWLSDQEGLENAFRAQAITVDAEQAWLETVRIKTQPPADRPRESLDGPLESLGEAVEFLQTPAGQSCLADALRELRQKLPRELTRAPVDPLQLDDPQTLNDILHEAEPLLMTRLRQEDER